MSVASLATSNGLRSSVTVDTTSLLGSTVNQKLLGGLHPFSWPEHLGDSEPVTARTAAAGVVKVQRTDKLLTCTPIKAGTVDGTHPTLGLSGSYSYDWQVVDRAIADATAQGAELIINLDSTPQILGGSVAPYSGATLTTSQPAFGGFAPEVPSSLSAYATMCVDLVHYVTVTRGVTVPYWPIGNEPDGGAEFWLGTPSEFFAYYAAIANAVKTFNPALKVGGPDVVDPGSNFTVWIEGLLTYCDTNAVPMDFVSIHDYSSRGWDLQKFVSRLDRLKTTLGWTDPLELLLTEWNSNPGLNPPFAPGKLPLDAQAAAFVAIELMEAQRLGFARAVFTKPHCEADDSFLAGLFSSEGAWATGNVYRLWDQIGAATLIEHSLDADPGLYAMAAKRAGHIYILLANYHYRPGKRCPVTVHLPGVLTGRVTTLTVIDASHSNQRDAGVENAGLQTVECMNVRGEQVRFDLAARSVVLLEIGL